MCKYVQLQSAGTHPAAPSEPAGRHGAVHQSTHSPALVWQAAVREVLIWQHFEPSKIQQALEKDTWKACAFHCDAHGVGEIERQLPLG
eukprot:1159499-Pelagomonas_calceolata.AAC.6